MNKSKLSIISILSVMIIMMIGCDSTIQSPIADASEVQKINPVQSAHSGSIVYVDANASGTEDGSQSDPFDTIQEGIDHASSGETVMLLSDFTLSSQVTINNSLTLDGNGNTVDAAFKKTSNSNNSAIGIIGTNDPVIVHNLKLTASGDEPWPKQLHGVNTYEAASVSLQSLDISGFEGSGVVVNSSTVTVSNITTADNGWHAINVDQKTNEPAKLTVTGTSSHAETYPPTPHIYIDDISKDVSVNDVESQYDSEEFTNPDDETVTARAYFLSVNPKTKDDCKKGGYADYDFKNQGQCIQFVNTGK